MRVPIFNQEKEKAMFFYVPVEWQELAVRLALLWTLDNPLFRRQPEEATDETAA